jgi:hypothetical protein
MEQVLECPKISIREVKPFVGGSVKCFGLECENANILPLAAVTDIPIRNFERTWLKTIDYITLDPFGSPKESRKNVNLELVNLSIIPENPMELRNRSSAFLRQVQYITNRDDSVYDSVLEIIKQGAKEGKIPLRIFAHGKDENGVWRVGNNREENIVESVPVETLLSNLPYILIAIDSKMPKNLKDRYSIIILEACNPGHVKISKECMNNIDVPILYSTDDIFPIKNPSIPELLSPKI